MNKLRNVLLLACSLMVGVPTGAAAAEKNQMIIGINQEFENLNPIIAQMAATFYLYYTVGHPINSIDANWKWQCWMCVTIPSIENGKAKRVKIDGKETIVAEWEIKENVKWGDGTPLTGNDVKLSWQIGSSPNVSVGSKDVWEAVSSIDVDPKNPRKFKMTYKEARYDYYQLATFYVVPAHLEAPVWDKTKDQMGAYEKQTTYSTNPTNPGLYSGPYVIKEIKLGSHVSVVRNPHFYGTPAKIERMTFRLIPNTQTLEANLLSGTIDMISEMGMTFDQALAFEKRVREDKKLAANYNVMFRDGMTYEHIDFNLRNPVLQDIRVRKALAYGVNRQSLVKALFEGKQKIALHNVHPLDEYFTDKVEKLDYRPDEANKLLEEAGWKKGADGIRAKDGKRLTMTIMTTAQNKARELVQVYLQQEWKKIGVETIIKNEPARVFFGETVRKAIYPDMAMFAWVSSPDSPPRSTLHTSEIPTPANAFKGQNSGAWSNAKVDTALDQIKTEFSFKKRKDLMAVLQKEYTKEVPTLPLYLRAEIAVVPTGLKNYRMTGHQFYSSLSANKWELH